MSIWLLASATIAVIVAAATGYRWAILLACVYAVAILGAWFSAGGVTR